MAKPICRFVYEKIVIPIDKNLTVVLKICLISYGYGIVKHLDNL